MSKKHNHIDYLSAEHFRAYRNGELSAEEMTAVESYLAANPFEAEALEGLETMSDDVLQPHLNDLNTRIDQRANDEKESKVVFWNLRRVAAGIILLASASALYFWPANESPLPTRELTENNAPEQETADGKPRAFANSDSVENETDDVPRAQMESNQPAVKAGDQNLTDALRGRVAGVQVTKPDSSREDFTPKNDGFVTVSDAVAAAPAPKVTTLPPVEIARWQDAAKKSIEEYKIKLADESELKQAQFQAAVKKREEAAVIAEAESQARLAQAKRNALLMPDSVKFVIPSASSGFVNGNGVSSFVQLDAVGSTISGRVTGKDDGQPLPQVTVLVPGTTIGTPTDTDGRFTINADTTIKSLLFRYLGYTTQTVDVKGKNIVNVSLEPDNYALGEVVMVAQGEAKRKDLAVTQFTGPASIDSQKGFNAYVKNNLRYPEAAKEKRVRGRVTLEFDLSAAGVISNIRVIKGLGYGCDEEAIRLLKESPAWTPKKNKQTGESVASQVQVKVRFKP